MPSTGSQHPAADLRRSAVLVPARDLPSPGAAAAVLRDVMDMAKGGITTFVVFTAAMGLWLAPGGIGVTRSVLFLAATAGLVASANMLNCWIEREADGLMHRTRNRPLPAGRLDPWSAVALAVALAAFSLPAIALVANPLTALLGFLALSIYVLVYTPLKRITPRALEVGAVPGAIPPLMGWAAATGGLGAPAWALFGIVAFWQLPHFIAIAICLREDYARGGMQVLPVARGPRTARRTMVAYALALLPVSMAPTLIGTTGAVYLATAAVLGVAFLGLAADALREGTGRARARRVFLYSLVYLPALFTVLVLDAS